MGVEELVDFLLKGDGFGGKSGENAGPEGGEDGAEGGRRRGGRGKVVFQPRVDVRVVDHGGDANSEFSGGFE